MDIIFLTRLLFVLLGASALMLTTLPDARQRVPVSRHSVLWEIGARASWTTGVVGTLVFFMSVFWGPSTGLAEAARGMALSFVPSVCGAALALGMAALAFRAAGENEGPRVEASTRPADGVFGRASVERWLGRALFAGVVAWPLLKVRLAAAGSPLESPISFLHWPAMLVLAGVVLAVQLLGGPRLWGRSATVVVAAAGTLTALVGLVRALLGLAGRDVAEVATGISFALTACFTALLGLALVTFPLDDRRRAQGEADGRVPAERVAWVVFPLFTLVLLAIALVLILTPMVRPA